ncbi:hypothetical protein [Paenibacillus lentus]|uniref:Uncharacterized protein n=1 Tax=Paenibacillus lentus TaxID=1338368 RepID=A0A3S8RWV4_9BACL|nr:hypothetical protein [Paenibacillus lentus]AZK47382.1 hypothetical protein EIM92_15485 [Paenibacillus lentus]
MERWIFTGAVDKRDLLLYICKVLASSGRKVLLIDATDKGKYRYVIGGIVKESEMSEFNGFDVARFGRNLKEDQIENYDYCIYDMDFVSPKNGQIWSMTKQIIWVTSYDRYEIAESIEFFSQLFRTWPKLQGMRVHYVFMRTMDSYVDEQYVMSMMAQLPIDWVSTEVRIPLDEVNIAVQTENEHSQTLHMNRITRAYKRAIMDLILLLAGWELRTVKIAYRKAERRKA